jgi:hypothetical protein
MRRALITAILSLTIGAQAQSAIPGQAPWSKLPKADTSAHDEEHPAVKADEKAYKSALDGIASKQAHDPWGNVREKPQPNSSR